MEGSGRKVTVVGERRWEESGYSYALHLKERKGSARRKREGESGKRGGSDEESCRVMWDLVSRIRILCILKRKSFGLMNFIHLICFKSRVD